MRSVFSDGTASVVGSGMNGNGTTNGAVVNLNDDAADMWDDAITLDMVTEAEGEEDEEVGGASLSFCFSLFDQAGSCSSYVRGALLLRHLVLLTRSPLFRVHPRTCRLLSRACIPFLPELTAAFRPY